MPDDAHWPAARVTEVGGRPQKEVRGAAAEVVVVFAYEEQDAPALLPVMDVALASL